MNEEVVKIVPCCSFLVDWRLKKLKNEEVA